MSCTPKVDWEPLPKRTRREKGREGKEDISLPRSSVRAAPTTQQTIDAAVKERINAHRAKGSLASQDGCAGENFECKLLASLHSLSM